MRKSLLAALVTAALINGCTTAPYGVEPGLGYAESDDRFIPPRNPYPAERDSYRDQRAYVDDRYDRPESDREAYERCRAGYTYNCPPDFFIQRLDGPRRPDRIRRPVATAAAAHGKWRVQLGVFRDKERAGALRARIAGIPALATHHTYLVIADGLTRIQAGPLPNAAAARNLCARVKVEGHDCVTKSL